MDLGLPDLQRQLPLDLVRREPLDFENYHPGPNAFLVAHLQALAGRAAPTGIYVYGQPASGKSHLLHAVCLAAVRQGRRAIYLPMRMLQHERPEMLEGLEQVDLVCLDDLQAIAGRQDWEHALFHFYNRLQERAATLLVTASAPPAQVGLKLPDLSSRLQALEVYQVHGLDDADRLCALQLRARQRGLILPDACAHYLLSHHARGLSELLAVLDELDVWSLATQRRLTIPLLRQVLMRAASDSGLPLGVEAPDPGGPREQDGRDE